MEENAVEQSGKRRRPRLWQPNECISNYGVSADLSDDILSTFTSKVEALRAGSSFVPAHDSYLQKHYQTKPVDLDSPKEYKEYYKQVKCARLRKQSMLLLNYARKEIRAVAMLSERYYQERDPRTAACIKELTKLKKQKIEYINHIRGSMVTIIGYGEEAAAFFERCIKILKSNDGCPVFKSE